MEGEIFGISDSGAPQQDFGYVPPIGGAGGGGGTPMRFVVAGEDYVVGIVVFSDTALATAVSSSLTIPWDQSQESWADFKTSTQEAIDAAIAELQSQQGSNPTQYSYAVLRLDDRGAVRPIGGGDGSAVQRLLFGGYADILLAGDGSDLPDDIDVQVLDTEECEYYAAVNGWGEENETGGEDSP